MLDWLLSFLILICVLVCVVVLVRWLISTVGFPIPQPLIVVAGIIIFLVCLLWFVSSGPFIHLHSLR